jgi:hypothetical protein
MWNELAHTMSLARFAGATDSFSLSFSPRPPTVGPILVQQDGLSEIAFEAIIEGGPLHSDTFLTGEDIMTLQQLEQRLNELERQFAQLQREIKPLRPYPNVKDTFGMFADDADFDEIVRLGREYRQQVNAEDGGC